MRSGLFSERLKLPLLEEVALWQRCLVPGIKTDFHRILDCLCQGWHMLETACSAKLPLKPAILTAILSWPLN